MKRTKLIIITIFCFIISAQISAQGFWDWSEPAPLTDSISDNINPHLYFNGTSFYMAWEKPIDSSTTAIWFRDITAQTPDAELLSTPGVHYKNPKLMGFWSNADFYLFYETNEAGNDDIYYMYNEGLGSFGDPVPFANTDFIENDFYPDHNVYYGRANVGMTWIKDSSVYYAQLLNNNQFTEPELIDSGLCDNPVFSHYGNTLMWEKGNPNSEFLALSYNSNDNWSQPDTFFYANKCANLKADKVGREYITFSFQEDSLWKICVAYCQYNYCDFDTIDINDSVPFHPAITLYFIPLDNSNFWWEGFLSFPYQDSNSVEIFMNYESWSGSQYANFSQQGTICRNPDFFYSPYPGDCDGIYLVWESYRNNHWQLYYSLAIQQCWGAINEIDIGKNFIKTHPNPFTHETTIEFTLDSPSDVTIDIYNNGMHISNLANKSFDPGTHQLRWNADGLAAGMYIIKMTVGGKTYTSKIVKSH